MNPYSDRPKIFGIGLNKTGTTTFGKCGEILGYRCTRCCHRQILEDVVLRNDLSRLEGAVAEHDLFQDWPWPLVYKDLDNLFPGSKFVLTTRRDANVWLNSLKRHSITTHPITHCRKLVYSYNFPHRHEHEHIEFYERHNESVRSYFQGRRDDFLEVCWENGDGWEKLCAFLGKNIPDEPFPKANRGVDRRAKKKWWYVMNRVFSFTGI